MNSFWSTKPSSSRSIAAKRLVTCLPAVRRVTVDTVPGRCRGPRPGAAVRNPGLSAAVLDRRIPDHGSAAKGTACAQLKTTFGFRLVRAKVSSSHSKGLRLSLKSQALRLGLINQCLLVDDVN